MPYLKWIDEEGPDVDSWLEELDQKLNKLNEPSNAEPVFCVHEWVAYHGFSEHYHYCKHCDAKRSLT